MADEQHKEHQHDAHGKLREVSRPGRTRAVVQAIASHLTGAGGVDAKRNKPAGCDTSAGVAVGGWR